MMKSILMAAAGVKRDVYPTLAQLSTLPASGFVDDPETGRYATTSVPYNAGYYPTNGYRVCPLTGIDLTKMKRFSAVFNMYYNTPANSIAYNIFRLTLSDGKVVLVGVYDQNTDASAGLWIFNGVAAGAGSNPKNTNVVDMELGYTVPDGVTITKVEWCSACYQNFPRAKNGVKDVKFTLR